MFNAGDCLSRSGLREGYHIIYMEEIGGGIDLCES